jgi:hypothetical protein
MKSPKTRQPVKIGFTMRNDQGEPTTDESLPIAAEPAAKKSTCMALVPMVQAAQWSQASEPQGRPNSIFVTQLIATAEPDPQARRPLHATAFNAFTAYTATQHRLGGAGIRRRQTV